jgi:hypothetical protein
MPKASPLKNNFNGGEFSELTILRTDVDRYPSGMRRMYNYVAAPQGPCLRRSGSKFKHTSFAHDKYSAIVPFVFSDEQANMLEFSDLCVRILAEEGILVYSNSAITNVVTTAPFKFTSAALVAAGAVVGEQVVLSAFPAARNLEGAIANITVIAGNDITVDATYNGATGAQAGPLASRVFKLTAPYSHNDVRKINYVQDVDLMYLFCDGYKPYKLSRLGALSWSIVPMDMMDGPFLDEYIDGPALTPNVTGRVTGGTPTDNGNQGGTYTGAKCFDTDLDTYYWGNASQFGIVTYTFAAPTALDGYYMLRTTDNDHPTYGGAEYGPTTWRAEGLLSGVWTVLDSKFDYPSWKNNRTAYTKFNSTVLWEALRINVRALGAKGAIQPRIAEIYIRAKTSPDITLTASAVTGVNGGAGFLATDVGRLVRVLQKDGFWRALKITAYTSPTVVTAVLQGEPLLEATPITRWRLGAFSDTTGWPTVGRFFNDRLAVAGASGNPTSVGISMPQAYETMSPTDPDGTVNPDNAMFLKPKTGSGSRLRWMEPNDKGILLGFGNSEWIIKKDAENEVFSARNVKAVRSTERGSADVQPVTVDNQVIFAQKSKRTLREYAYVFENDAFRSPSMSLFASHLGAPKFKQIVHAAEPYSIVWGRMEDESIIGLTYNRDENVIGWHRHNFGGGVESIGTIPGGNKPHDRRQYQAIY